MAFRSMAAASLLATGSMFALLPGAAHAFELSDAWASRADIPGMSLNYSRCKI